MKKIEIIIVKEFKVPVNNTNLIIKGCIFQNKNKKLDKRYYGKLSHYWKPNELATGAYRPSFQSNSIISLENEMKAHIKSFVPIGVIENEEYYKYLY